MSKRRMIDTRFWSDNFIVDLNPLDRYLFLYFLTNEHTNICGIYELPLKRMADETGIEKDMIEKMLKRLEGRVVYIEGWVAIKNFAKYQSDSEKVKIGIENARMAIPSHILQKIDRVWIGYDSVPIESDISELESESELKVPFSQKDMEMVDLLISLIVANNPAWVMRGNKDTWAEDINKISRIDGRSYEQIEFMIRWVQKDSFWSQNILSASKLREKFNDLIPKLKGNKKKREYVL